MAKGLGGKSLAEAEEIAKRDAEQRRKKLEEEEEVRLESAISVCCRCMFFFPLLYFVVR